jgi:RNA polymerase sigma-70 factor (ECF subfamily)
MQLSKQNTSELLSRSDYFLSLFEPERKRIYAYVYALVQNKTVADDVFQDVSTLLWQEFNSFIPNSSFTKWSNAIVFNCVRTYRHKNKRYLVGLSEEVFDQLIDIIDRDEDIDRKWGLLQSCLSKLTLNTYRVYHGFYVESLSADNIAKKYGRSIYGVRKSLRLLRKTLFDCIDSKQSEDNN